MARVYSSAGEAQTMEQITTNYEDREAALLHYFITSSESVAARFLGYTQKEIWEQLDERLAEIDKAGALSLMAAIEAAFRVNYLSRVARKKKDPLSKAFRKLFEKKNRRPKLEEEILKTWRNETEIPERVFNQLIEAFKYRHWLAHGRYWSVCSEHRFKFTELLLLTDLLNTNIPELRL
jgi:hypothetical protein